MPDFRVTKRRVPVKVLVSDRVQESDVFLTSVSARHDGSETLSDLLNGADAYLPLEHDGELLCIPREAIEVAWSSSPDPVDGEELSPPTEQKVRITLHSGRQLRGSMRYSRSPDSSRLVDYLNDSPLFVELHQGDQLALVNRRHIALVQQDGVEPHAKQRGGRRRLRRAIHGR